jgi:hypothetical protein
MKRKYSHDFFARKEYLNYLKLKNEAFLDDLKKVLKLYILASRIGASRRRREKSNLRQN